MSSGSLKTAAARGWRATAIVLALALLALLVSAPAVLAKGGMGANVQVRLADQVVTAGEQVTITVMVRPAEVGTKVTLYRMPAGGDWEVVGTKLVGEPSGKVTFVDSPTRHTWYRAKWTWLEGRSLWSNTAWQKVKALLTVQAKVAVYQQGMGTPVTIYGKLIPAWNGQTVRVSIARWESGCLVPVASFAVPLTPGPGDSSLYSVTWNAMMSGDYVVRAQVKRAPHFFGSWTSTGFSL